MNNLCWMGTRTDRAAAFVLALAMTSLVFVTHAEATPWMSLQAGTPCHTCHVNTQGGGMRTEIGWGAGAYTGMVQWDQFGDNWLADRMTNEVVEDWVAVGWDIRSQSARIGQPDIQIGDDGTVDAELADRQLFLMQAQPYVSVTPHEKLELYGTWAYAAGENITDNDGCVEQYSGQSCYAAMAIVHATRDLTLRAGVLQPSIGIRHDDHTMLIREDVSRGPVIPANYAEPGGEITYQPAYWLRLDAGAFQASNLSEAIGDPPRVQSSDAAFLGRVSFLPLIGERRNLRFSTRLGASVYGAGDFMMENIFAGVGWLNKGSIILESAFMQYQGGGDDAPTARNLSAQLYIQLQPWLIFTHRVEQGNANRGGEEFNELSYVGGFQWFPVPYLEVRPEYRHTTTDRFYTGQYTIQLHLFY